MAEGSQRRLYILITGANSGLGFSTTIRLIDDFLEKRPVAESLCLIGTTRSTQKSTETERRVQYHLTRKLKRKRAEHPDKYALSRVHFQSEQVDLTSLKAVLQLAGRLRATIPRLDVLICNAGIGGWLGPNWPKAAWAILTDTLHAATWPDPEFNRARRGWLTKAQIEHQTNGSAGGKGSAEHAADSAQQDPPLGQVFCANVFGHYFLAHQLGALLSHRRPSDGGLGRVVWVSSITPMAEYLSLDDLQALQTNTPYESSKRLTDLLALTSRMPATRRSTSTFWQSAPAPPDTPERAREAAALEPVEPATPRMYVTQPGVVQTGVMPLPPGFSVLLSLLFYILRFMGSPWHMGTPYKAAVSLTWLALVPQAELDANEEEEGTGKYGSSTDRWGNERVARTEVDWWGWGGKVGEKVQAGRKRGARIAKKEDREAFVDMGRRCWVAMEDLRLQWEQLLKDG